MKKLIVGCLAALAIGLTGCGTAASSPPVEEAPAGVPFDIAEVVVDPSVAKTSCLMVVPDRWLCLEGIHPPQTD